MATDTTTEKENDESNSAKNDICTSVFKNGAEFLTTENYTRFWAEAINAMEQNKGIGNNQ